MPDTPTPATSLPRVVIIGGGFGGLYAARALAEAPVQVTLVDRRNHHVFQPLLYQVATAALNPSDIAAPIRGVLRQQANARVLLAEAAGIDLPGRIVRLADGDALPFDYLIVATGATHSYFGHEDWAPVAPGLKTLEDAIEIRSRVLLAYEAAERSTDAAERRALLTFVIVGGGPTGVELAGALGVPLDRAGRAIVDDHLHPPGHDNVWIVGDLAAASDGGRPIPGVAGAAIQGGQYAGRSIIGRARGNGDGDPFRYVDKGSMATIGRASAVADFGRLRLSGFFAWLAWGLVHIMFLIGFRNRVLVMLQWLWQYVTFQRGARLIPGAEPPLVRPKARSGDAATRSAGGTSRSEPPASSPRSR